jgi:hypothetical protein
LINEKNSQGWAEVFNRNEIKIMKKEISGNSTIMLKTFAIIKGYNSSVVFKAIADVEIRKKWDSVFTEFKIIDLIEKDKSEILYMRIKVKFKNSNIASHLQFLFPIEISFKGEKFGCVSQIKILYAWHLNLSSTPNVQK